MQTTEMAEANRFPNSMDYFCLMPTVKWISFYAQIIFIRMILDARHRNGIGNMAG